MLKLHFYSISLDEIHQECREETVTEMVTETVMEPQCTGKYFHFQNKKNNFINAFTYMYTTNFLLLLYHHLCR